MLTCCKRALLFLAAMLIIPGTAGAATPLMTGPGGQAKIALFEACQSYPLMNGRLLDSCGAKFDYFEMSSLATVPLEGYRLVIIGESWLRSLDLTALRRSGPKMEKYLADGGRVVAFRNGADPNAWLPRELKVKRDTRELRMPILLQKTHPVFNIRHSLAEEKFGFFNPPPEMPISSLKALMWGGSIINPFTNPSAAWTPLVQGSVEKEGLSSADYVGYGLMEASYGKGGKVLLCEMIPVFSAAERRSETGKFFVENILAYLGGQ